jgi:hypothetical protein
VIAENGCGDCLFLKTSTAGKIDPKVYVYWHEEERSEVFAKSVKELTETKPSVEAAASSEPATKISMSLAELEQALSSDDSAVRMDAWRDFKKSDFGLEVLPMLRRLLMDDYVGVVNEAAECIAKLGPQARTCPAGQETGPYDYCDLEKQLKITGNKLWSYSGYTNSYSVCLKALMKLEVDGERIVDYVHSHIGLIAPFDVEANFTALAQVGTPEANDLMKRAEAFWLPELNMAQAKKVKAIMASAGKAESPKKKAKKK